MRVCLYGEWMTFCWCLAAILWTQECCVMRWSGVFYFRCSLFEGCGLHNRGLVLEVESLYSEQCVVSSLSRKALPLSLPRGHIHHASNSAFSPCLRLRGFYFADRVGPGNAIFSRNPTSWHRCSGPEYLKEVVGPSKVPFFFRCVHNKHTERGHLFRVSQSLFLFVARVKYVVVLGMWGASSFTIKFVGGGWSVQGRVRAPLGLVDEPRSDARFCCG